jgi:hypothetical protein
LFVQNALQAAGAASNAAIAPDEKGKRLTCFPIHYKIRGKKIHENPPKIYQ